MRIINLSSVGAKQIKVIIINHNIGQVHSDVLGLFYFINMIYKNLLKSPQWQRKRLEIFNRDNFTCQCCKSKNKELHVHHLQYKKGVLPQDYENEMLVTLCFDCHDFAHNELQKIASLMSFFVLTKGIDFIDLQSKLEKL